jgi:4-amino-4-deoxy-L-arabinose transferase-like glycosyltransferase
MVISVGLGVDALLFFWFRRAFLTIEWLLIIPAIVTGWHFRNFGTETEISASPHEFVLRHEIVKGLRGLLVIAAVTAASFFGFKTSEAVHGAWDAWAIWNLHARLLVRAGSEWLSILNAVTFSNPDYPLLLPGMIARFWRFTGTETTLVPIGIAFVFTALTVVFLYAIVKTLRSETFAIFSAITILGTPFFLQHGAEQYADVPFGFFVLVSLGLIWLYEDNPRGQNGLLILAGFHAGLAAWAKNEGILLLAVVPLSYVLVSLPSVRQTVQKLLWMLAGASLPLVTLGYFKLVQARTDVLVASQALPQIVSRIFDIHRHATIVARNSLEMWTFGQWYYSPIPVLLLWAILHNFGPWKFLSLGFRIVVLTLLLIVAGYYFVYLITPIPLTDHLRSSLNRLLLQLWPVALIPTFVMIGRTSEIESRRWQLVPMLAIVTLAATVFWIGSGKDTPAIEARRDADQFKFGAPAVGYFVLVPQSGTPPNVIVKATEAESGSSFVTHPPKLSTHVEIDLGAYSPSSIAIAVVNPDAAAQAIRLTIKEDATEKFGDVKLCPGCQTSSFLPGLIPSIASGEHKQGRLILQSANDFAALVLRNGSSGFIPLDVDMIAPGGDTIVFPQFALFGGWMMEITVENTSSSPAAGRLAFFSPHHSQWTVRLNGMENHTFNYSIGPGARLHYSPAF